MIGLIPDPTTCHDTGEKVTLKVEVIRSARVGLTCPACGETWEETLRIPGWRLA